MLLRIGSMWRLGEGYWGSRMVEVCSRLVQPYSPTTRPTLPSFCRLVQRYQLSTRVQPTLLRLLRHPTHATCLDHGTMQ